MATTKATTGVIEGGLGAVAALDTVATAYIDDNSVTLAKMAHGTDGNIITYDAAGAPAAVTTGTAGQVLTSGGVGAAPTFAATGTLSNIVEDTTPQLGGDLDLNGNVITGLVLSTGTNTGDNSANSLYSGLVSNATHTGDVTGSGALTIAAGAVDIAMHSATGTPSGTTYLRGDNTWATAGATDLTTTAAPATVTINSSDGTNAAIAAADVTNAGVMTKAMFDAHVLNNAKITNATHTGDVTGGTALTIASGAVDIAMHSATGVASVTTYLRGDNTWATVGTGTLSNIVEDATPQLGGDLDLNGNVITGLVLSTGTNTGDNSANSLYSGITTNATHTGDVTGSGALTIAAGAVDIAMHSATGTPSGTTYLRGDNTWATVGGGGSLNNIVEDTTPQLGGDLDLNGNVITGLVLSTGTNTGDEAAASLTVSGTIEIATVAETNTGTDATRAVSPAGLTGWTGDTGIVTVGTIGTGTWQGTAIAEAYIADNSVTLAKMAHGVDGNLITYDALGAPAAVATGTSGQVLTSGGAGVAPTFAPGGSTGTVTSVGVIGGTTGLTTTGGPITSSGDITLTGTLAVANGGTGVTSSTGTGSVVLSTSPTLVTPALGTPASGVLTNTTGLPPAGVVGTAAILGANTFTALQTFKAGADIAAATAIDLTAATGNTVVITGTTASTSLTMTAGQQMVLLPSGAWPMTYHATTMNINGGVSYTCAAGDRIEAFKDLAGVIRVNVVKQDGTAVVAAGSGATDINGLTDGYNVGSSVGLGTGALANDDGTNNYNTAVGDNALNANTTGANNTAIGMYALKDSTGDDNTASGFYALWRSTGDKNTASGYKAAYNSTTGDTNTATGYTALFGNTTGSNNTGSGYYANGSSGTVSNEFTLGDTAISNLRCNDTTISSLSDERDKTNITDLPASAGLGIINALRPVTFNWDRREWYDDGVADGSKVMPDWRRWKANSGLKYGFIAQEVQATIAGEKCMADSMIITDENLDKLEFAPQHLLTNAIKAIQQLSTENEALKIRLTALETA
jgi:hypothetical protein